MANERKGYKSRYGRSRSSKISFSIRYIKQVARLPAFLCLLGYKNSTYDIIDLEWSNIGD